MTWFFLFVALFGVILGISGWKMPDDDEIYQLYLDKSARGEAPTGEEAARYWTLRVLSLAPFLIVVGVVGFLFAAVL